MDSLPGTRTQDWKSIINDFNRSFVLFGLEGVNFSEPLFR